MLIKVLSVWLLYRFETRKSAYTKPSEAAAWLTNILWLVVTIAPFQYAVPSTRILVILAGLDILNVCSMVVMFAILVSYGVRKTTKKE